MPSNIRIVSVQMRLRDELSRCLHTECHVRALMVVVIQKSISALLSEDQVRRLEGGLAELLTAQGAVEALDERLVIFPVRASDDMLGTDRKSTRLNSSHQLISY